MGTHGFIARQAIAYADATEQLTPWIAYGREVVEQWAYINHPIQPVNDAVSYLNVTQLCKDILTGKPIRVWAGGKFSGNHPLKSWTYIGDPLGNVPVFMVSRVLHDYNAHYRQGYSFSPMDDLIAARVTRLDFSQQAQLAQWTDDVAMSCYYAYFGKWPEVQRPVIVKPDWEGLEEYINV